MSHVIRIVLHCDRAACGEEFTSGARAVSQARRLAAREGWESGRSNGDARLRYDLCPAHAVQRLGAFTA